MKWLLTLVLFFQFMSSYAQYIYVAASEPFQVLVSEQNKPQTAIWIKMSDLNHPVSIKLQNGQILNRVFSTADADAKYVITDNAVRYRPNMTMEMADTIAQPILQTMPNRDLSQMTGTLEKIEALPYEFEKLEAVKRELSKPGLLCSDILNLINCLKYDAQKVEVINQLTGLPEGCESQLKTSVSEAYQTLIK